MAKVRVYMRNTSASHEICEIDIDSHQAVGSTFVRCFIDVRNAFVNKMLPFISNLSCRYEE